MNHVPLGELEWKPKASSVEGERTDKESKDVISEEAQSEIPKPPSGIWRSA